MIILGIIFAFMDGLLLWGIGLFVLGITIGFILITWGIAGWMDKTARRLSGDEPFKINFNQCTRNSDAWNKTKGNSL